MFQYDSLPIDIHERIWKAYFSNIVLKEFKEEAVDYDRQEGTDWGFLPVDKGWRLKCVFQHKRWMNFGVDEHWRLDVHSNPIKWIQLLDSVVFKNSSQFHPMDPSVSGQMQISADYFEMDNVYKAEQAYYRRQCLRR
jgi:hypothetical protein